MNILMGDTTVPAPVALRPDRQRAMKGFSNPGLGLASRAARSSDACQAALRQHQGRRGQKIRSGRSLLRARAAHEWEIAMLSPSSSRGTPGIARKLPSENRECPVKSRPTTSDPASTDSPKLPSWEGNGLIPTTNLPSTLSLSRSLAAREEAYRRRAPELAQRRSRRPVRASGYAFPFRQRGTTRITAARVDNAVAINVQLIYGIRPKEGGNHV